MSHRPALYPTVAVRDIKTTARGASDRLHFAAIASGETKRTGALSRRKMEKLLTPKVGDELTIVAQKNVALKSLGEGRTTSVSQAQRNLDRNVDRLVERGIRRSSHRCRIQRDAKARRFATVLG